MTRWTDKDVASYERRFNGMGALPTHDLPAAGRGQTPAQGTATARGGTAQVGRGGGEKSKAGELLAHQLNELMRLGAVREWHMANIDPNARGWRFDFAFPDVKLLVELHGALGAGKHSRKAGQTNDLEKANAATEAGWSVLSYSTALVNSGSAAIQVERVVLRRRRLLAGGTV